MDNKQRYHRTPYKNVKMLSWSTLSKYTEFGHRTLLFFILGWQTNLMRYVTHVAAIVLLIETFVVFSFLFSCAVVVMVCSSPLGYPLRWKYWTIIIIKSEKQGSVHSKSAYPVRYSGSVIFSLINGPFVDQVQCNKIQPGNGREISLS